MPYNTRRKSLSLTELGIILPKRSRVPSHPSPPSTVNGEEPPSKRARVSDGAGSMSPPPARTHTDSTPRKSASQKARADKATRPAQLSPPPSPVREGDSKVDTEGINDDVVVGTIEQLQKTGNRPHLVKELAAILAPQLNAVDKSANPCALISSRLASYLNRPRPAFSPCPLAKLIEPVHPRRLYFHLTTMPRQDFPRSSDDVVPQARITPSLSSADEAEEEEEDEIQEPSYPRSRIELSPSPEIDLSSPELDEDEVSIEPASPARSFPTQVSASQECLQSPKDLSHNRRAVSPQLEPEERTFKQTASDMYAQEQIRRQSSRDIDMDVHDIGATAIETKDAIIVSVQPEESEEHTARKNQEAVAELFQQAESLRMPTTTVGMSSPMIMPQPTLSIDVVEPQHTDDRHDEVMEGVHIDLKPKERAAEVISWDNLQSPENIELDELDDMFDDF